MTGPNEPWTLPAGKTIDFAVCEASNRRLGKFGEEFRVELEKTRLLKHGWDDLAKKVEWVSQSRVGGETSNPQESNVDDYVCSFSFVSIT